MTNLTLFPARAGSAKILLEGIARDSGDKIKDVVVLAMTDDREGLEWSTTSDPVFLSIASVILGRLAQQAVAGELVEVT